MRRIDRRQQRLAKCLEQIRASVAETAAALDAGDVRLAALRNAKLLKAGVRLAETMAKMDESDYWRPRSPRFGEMVRRARTERRAA